MVDNSVDKTPEPQQSRGLFVDNFVEMWMDIAFSSFFQMNYVNYTKKPAELCRFFVVSFVQ